MTFNTEEGICKCLQGYTFDEALEICLGEEEEGSFQDVNGQQSLCMVGCMGCENAQTCIKCFEVGFYLDQATEIC